jgi:uncharacterized membrane protein
MPQATLTVWRFDTPEGAQNALQILERLARENVISLSDAATVSWPAGEPKPHTHQVQAPVGVGAMGSAFWGLVFGLIFFVPLLGAELGAATGAVSGSLADVGIDDSFINRVRDQVTPGTSALFVISPDAVLDRLKDEFAANAPADLVYTHLSADQEGALRKVLAEA